MRQTHRTEAERQQDIAEAIIVWTRRAAEAERAGDAEGAANCYLAAKRFQELEKGNPR